MGQTTSTSSSSSTPTPPALRTFKLDDIIQHNKDKGAEQMLLAIHGKVYDVSKFQQMHPGGAKVLQDEMLADATAAFDSIGHSRWAISQLEQYLVGTLEGVEQTEPEAGIKKPRPQGAVISSQSSKPSISIFYGSQQGKSEKYAKELYSALRVMLDQQFPSENVSVKLINMKEADPEDLSKEKFAFFILSTYTNGVPPDNAKFFCEWIYEAAVDCRVGPEWLSSLSYSVCALGNSLYDPTHFARAGLHLSECLQKIGGKFLCPTITADENAARDDGKQQEDDFQEWVNKITSRLKVLLSGASDSQPLNQNQDEKKAEEEEEEEYESEEEEDVVDDEEKVLDVEDLGKIKSEKPKPKPTEQKSAPREMVSKTTREALNKQGYKIIGSHSGVKVCRWTKAMLRGRGGCYKNCFYGIISYQCMEMTPSLACANKCVFCWRHHTNPVGKEWKWVTDSPEFIYEGAVSNHRAMIKQLKGVPGVKKEHFEEALTPKHCALSLVGEPIMYPYINEYLQLLHKNHISTFLVTNAQFPDRIRQLTPVTQLYVSVDAATQDTLKAVDRPLFSDFWQRFLDSLTALKDFKQRTVYRLTLVKGQNMGDICEYARLVTLGNPTFIEIKGVTFCGDVSTSANLSMKNVPFHEEVRAFALEMCKYLGDTYEVACEHVHSCCILISDTKLKIDGVWHTWIDYPKFHELAMEYQRTGKQFTTFDYLAKTPEWALFGAKEQGFNPDHEHVKVKGKKDRNQVRLQLEQEQEKEQQEKEQQENKEAQEQKESSLSSSSSSL